MFIPYWHNPTECHTSSYHATADYESARHAEIIASEGFLSHDVTEEVRQDLRLARSGVVSLADTQHEETVGNNNPHNWWIMRERREARRALFTEYTSTYASAFSRITSHWGTPFLSSGHGSRHARSWCSRVQIRRNSFRTLYQVLDLNT